MRFAARELPAGRRPLERLFERAVSSAKSAVAGRRRIRSVSIAVVGDRTMRRLNRDFHATDATTDVLAFDLSDDRAIEGEIVVCAPYARRQALSRGLPWRTELVLYVTHGILHLLGEEDHTPSEARRMRRFEFAILARLKFALPRSHLHELKFDADSADA